MESGDTAQAITSPKSFSVAIVGGGISGLVLAVGLQRRNIPITLYEAAARFGEIGAGVSFGPNAVDAMILIDPAIRKGFDNRATYNQWESSRSSWFDFRVGDDRWKENHSNSADRLGPGEWFYQLANSTGQSSVHRAHFLDEMVKLLKGDVARFGKRLVDFDHLESGDVRLRFQDGTEAIHDAVIGCDGIKSKMREVLLGRNHPCTPAVFSGKYAYRGLIPMEEAVELLGDELARNSQMYTGYHGHLLTFPIEKGKTMNGQSSLCVCRLCHLRVCITPTTTAAHLTPNS
jgi:salicylate hydroxylase